MAVRSGPQGDALEKFLDFRLPADALELGRLTKSIEAMGAVGAAWGGFLANGVEAVNQNEHSLKNPDLPNPYQLHTPRAGGLPSWRR